MYVHSPHSPFRFNCKMKVNLKEEKQSETTTYMSTYSVIVPTYKEQGNLEELTRRLFAAMYDKGFGKGSVELLIVDDNSSDGTVETVQSLATKYNIRLLERKTERGLSSAVIAGINTANGEFLLVMDADLQHPPETAPLLLLALGKPGVEFVLGTRYKKGFAIDQNWPLHRRIISWGARILARPLTPLSDPMSGLFAIRRDVFRRGRNRVSPIGYKIALELFVKCNVKKFDEVGFSFASRTIGESKLTGKVIVHYIKHLHQLFMFRYRGVIYGLLLVLFLFIFEIIYFVFM